LPIRGHRQLTDVYLLGLAQRNGGRLATFDRSIPLQAVTGAGPDALIIIGPADED
jgi:predicted nucleic acid-binding protein